MRCLLIPELNSLIIALLSSPHAQYSIWAEQKPRQPAAAVTSPAAQRRGVAGAEVAGTRSTVSSVTGPLLMVELMVTKLR